MLRHWVQEASTFSLFCMEQKPIQNLIVAGLYREWRSCRTSCQTNLELQTFNSWLLYTQILLIYKRLQLIAILYHLSLAEMFDLPFLNVTPKNYFLYLLFLLPSSCKVSSSKLVNCNLYLLFSVFYYYSMFTPLFTLSPSCSVIAFLPLSF